MLRRGRILLVDDEPLVLEMFETFLSHEQFDVKVAPSSEVALSDIERFYFDALVCDIKLDGVDGFGIMRAARKRNPSIGAILITGAPSEDDAQLAAENNAYYLSKPVGFDILLEAIESVVVDRDRSLEAI